jgi:SAM-dependent methyltransferase
VDDEGPIAYEAMSVAARYADGRRLDDDALAAWRVAVAPHLDRLPPGVVVDVGAGVGIFSAALAAWSGRPIVAIEPSPAMRAQAPIDRAHWIAGVAERLPLRDGSVAAAWLSAVFHHLRDVDAAIRELRRVTADGAVVLVRGFFRSTSSVGWLERFPGHERAYRRFPDLDATRHAFASGGFSCVAVHEVTERHAGHGDAATWARAMRGVDSLLAELTDDEFEAGLRALDDDAAGSSTVRLGLLVVRSDMGARST